MKFDAYAASINGETVRNVADCLATLLDGIPAAGKPIRRFRQTVNIDLGTRTAAWIGQDDKTGMIYIEGKGESTPALVDAIRGNFPTHSAPRIDVAHDVNAQTAFDDLQRLVRENKGPRVKGGYVALPDDVQDGKTWAAGVRGGVSFIRVYEAGKHPDRLHLCLPNWTRLELECRPHYARDKVAASTMTPIQVWGMSAWTHRVAEAVMHSDIPRYEPEVRRFSHTKTQRYVAVTFRRMFEQMIADGEHIEATIKHIWSEEDEYRRRRMN